MLKKLGQVLRGMGMKGIRRKRRKVLFRINCRFRIFRTSFGLRARGQFTIPGLVADHRLRRKALVEEGSDQDWEEVRDEGHEGGE